MKRTVTLIMLFMVSAISVRAQDVGQHPPPWAEAEMARLKKQLVIWELETSKSAVELEIAERRAAQYRQREFVEKANRFAAIWKKLFGDYGKQGSFNVKDARALSKAFHDLEATGWPK
jgi:hypothetical protein